LSPLEKTYNEKFRLKRNCGQKFKKSGWETIACVTSVRNQYISNRKLSSSCTFKKHLIVYEVNDWGKSKMQMASFH